jgi:hypothetical protein
VEAGGEADPEARVLRGGRGRARWRNEGRRRHHGRRHGALGRRAAPLLEQNVILAAGEEQTDHSLFYFLSLRNSLCVRVQRLQRVVSSCFVLLRL